MTDAIGFGAMLFGPEHALQVAADAIEGNAKSPDMAVGITLGIKAAIVEYQRLFTSMPGSAQNDQETKESPKARPDKTAELARR
jgi:hypothetical protein